MSYLLLIVGFLLLIKGADYFVDGSSNVAKLLKVPSIVIGLTVVAFGTSMPEASVSINAALQGNNGLAVSNVLGSNIFNLLMVLGASALMRPLKTKEDVLNKEFPFSIIITMILFALCTKFDFSGITSKKTQFSLGRLSGIILLVLFIGFVAIQIRDALKARKMEKEAEETKELSFPKSLFLIGLGLLGIILGGELVVESASDIAVQFGWSQTFIGLTIVAMGTSLPELVTSMVAAKKGENDLALGNVIGSNIFNILLILGLSATIFPIIVGVEAVIDMLILSVFSIIGLIMAKSKKTLDKKEGICFILMYVIYFVYIYLR